MTAIHGHVEPGFEAVEAAFRENFAERGEIGASACVTHEGRVVVDLWGGLADRERGTPWEADTLGMVFSATKGLAALCLLMLCERGKLAWDAPLAQLWPEFAAAGKQEISLRTLMNHRSGLVAIDHPLLLADFADPPRIAAALAAQEPLWTPGSAQGYGAVTMGAYAGEIARRAEGRSIGRFLASEVAEPLGADVHLGLDARHEPRVAKLYTGSILGRAWKLLPEILRGNSVDGRLARAFLARRSPTRRALANPRPGPEGIQVYNSRMARELELPWAGGMASARGLARVYAALALGGSLDGITLCTPAALEAVHARQSWEQDRVLCKTMGFSQGFVKEEPEIFSPHSEAFGHPGMGGALGLADPVERVSIAYVPNRMDHRLRSPRCLALCHAVYASLGAGLSSLP